MENNTLEMANEMILAQMKANDVDRPGWREGGFNFYTAKEIEIYAAISRLPWERQPHPRKVDSEVTEQTKLDIVAILSLEICALIIDYPKNIWQHRLAGMLNSIGEKEPFDVESLMLMLQGAAKRKTSILKWVAALANMDAKEVFQIYMAHTAR